MADTPTKSAPKRREDEERSREDAEVKSRDARFSTYRPANDDELDNADEVLPPGPHVMQEPGEPNEGAEPGFKFANKKR